jgi:hypothetical protein
MPNRSARLYVLTLFLVFSASIFGWHFSDTRPSSMDETRHMKLATDYRAWLAHGVPLTNEWSHVYPPLYHLSLIPALSLGAPSETKAAATHLLYLMVFIAGCVLLGRSRKRPDWESLMGATLCLGYVYVLWASRRALTDFPLMAWVTLSMATLARTEGFSRWRDSLLWGTVAGAGLLIKAPFVFFSVGPVLWVLASSHHPSKMKNFFAAFALCLAISVPWYFWQGTYFLQKALSLAAEPTGQGTDPHSLSGWLFYIRLLHFQLGTASLLFTGIGLALALARRTRGSGLLIAWILSGYVILSLLTNKDPRHTLPLLPALAILAIDGWGSLAIGASWGPAVISVAAPVLFLANMALYDRPGREDWEHREILALMAARHDTTQPFLEASIMTHHPRFFARTVLWSAMERGIDMRTVSGGDADTSFAEYIVTKPGDDNSEKAFLDRQWQDLRPQTRAFTELFSVRARYPLPDHSEAVVYERNPHPRFDVHPLNHQELERHIAQALRTWVQGPLAVKTESVPASLQEGRLTRVTITCDACSVQKIPLRDIRVVVEKPWFNLYRLWDEDRLGLMAFESLKAGVRVKAEDVQMRLTDVKGLKDASVQFADDKIRVRGRYQGIPVGLSAHIVVDHSRYSRVVVVLDRITLAGLPLPGWLLGKASRQILWTYPIPDFPGKILIDRVVIRNGEILIS